MVIWMQHLSHVETLKEQGELWGEVVGVAEGRCLESSEGLRKKKKRNCERGLGERVKEEWMGKWKEVEGERKNIEEQINVES